MLDRLTAVYDRMSWFDRLEAEIADAREAGTGTAVVVVEVEHVRELNATHGHRAGDAVLRETAARITNATRTTDGTGRLGGGEFGVIVHPTDDPRRAASDLAERLAAVLSRPVSHGVDRVPVTVTIGYAWTATSTTDADTLVREAGLALTESRRRRAGVVGADVDARSLAGDADELDRALRRAIAQDELVAWAQPIVALADGTPRGVELLVRWERPGHGLVPPGVFIPHAERNGLVVDIARIMMRQAGLLLERWATNPDQSHLKVAVNVGARHLLSGALIDDVRDLLTEHPRCAGHLTVELTETEFVEDTSTASETLAALVELGIGIAIDDFGTGFSSLAYFHSLPATVVKVDRSFVQHAGRDPGSAAIIRAVVGLGDAFGRVVVAEGIEDQTQADVIRSLGVALGQGYHFARPMPLPALAEWLDAQPRLVSRTPGR